MKKLILLLVVFTNLAFSQTTALSEKILNDIISQNDDKFGTVEILAKPVPSLVEKHLVKLIHTKDRIFTDTVGNSKNSVKLTEEERNYLLTELRLHYKSQWKKEDFKNYNLSDNSTKSGHVVREDRIRTLVTITKPILIRNNEIALVYFGKFIHQKEYGHTDLTFYKKDKSGVWKKFVTISSKTDSKNKKAS